jgi:hypothetical protein
MQTTQLLEEIKYKGFIDSKLLLAQAGFEPATLGL